MGHEMKSKFITIIPTKGRAEYFLSRPDITIARFNDKMFNPHLWVHESEVDAYESTMKKLGFEGVAILPNRDRNIAEARQGYLEHAHQHGYEYLFSPDDDLTFHDMANGHKPADMSFDTSVRIFNALMPICSPQYPFATLRERFMVNGAKYKYEKARRILCVYCLHVPTIMSNDIGFTYKEFPAFEDWIIGLKMSEKGFTPITTLEFTTSQRIDWRKNPLGGIGYRSDEMQNRCCRILCADFPHVTRLERQSGDPSSEKLNVRFFFKRYLKEGELPYVPIEEMNAHMNRKDACRI